MRPEDPDDVQPGERCGECARSGADASHHRRDGGHSLVVRKGHEANPVRERVRGTAWTRMEPAEDDELVDPLGQSSDEEDERTVGRDAVAVGAVDQVCVDPETHVRRETASIVHEPPQGG